MNLYTELPSESKLPNESESKSQKPKLESKRYEFLVKGTMPVLDFEITTGASDLTAADRQELTLELYNPLAGEVFEAKFNTGRVEVDNDGSITYFTTKIDHVNFSIFLGRNLTISMNKSGEVLIKTPSTIKSIETDIKSDKSKKRAQVTSDSIKLQLE